MRGWGSGAGRRSRRLQLQAPLNGFFQAGGAVGEFLVVDELALLVEHDGGGVAGHGELLGNAFGLGDDGKAEVAALLEELVEAFGLVEGEGEEHHVGLLEGGSQAFEGGHFLDAVGAVDKPEIEHDDLAAQGFGADRAALQVDGGEAGGGRVEGALRGQGRGARGVGGAGRFQGDGGEALAAGLGLVDGKLAGAQLGFVFLLGDYPAVDVGVDRVTVDGGALGGGGGGSQQAQGGGE